MSGHGHLASAPAQLERVVVAVDPAVGSGQEGDETGIVVVGRDEAWQGYVLADLSGRYPPHEWAQRVARAYHLHRADAIIAEVNQGGELVRDMLRVIDPDLPVRKVHATRGKYQRAEPVAGLYEQGRVHHIGCHAALEDQMCVFTPDLDRKTLGSPDRVDALVWGLTHLLIKGRRMVAESIQG